MRPLESSAEAHWATGEEDNGSREHAAWQNASGGDHSGCHGALHPSRRRVLPQEQPLLRRDAQPLLLIQQHRR